MRFIERLAGFLSGGRQTTAATIDPELLHTVVQKNVALAAGFDSELATRHFALTQQLVHEKSWEAAAGFELNDEMVVTIAANAALPILGLDTWVYRMVKGVIVHPSTTVSHGQRSGPGAGTVSDAAMAVVGVATPNSGPMILSWDTVLADSRNPSTGRNVVIHEFAHKIDMSDGYTDGIPPVRGAEVDRWAAVLAAEYESTKARTSDRVLRQYAWTNKAEFFAVATEAFFCHPHQLHDGKPELYAALADFFQQDPAIQNR